jgi:hypothetical protein
LSRAVSVQVVESPDDAVLHRIAEHDVALAIWHRPQTAGLAAWLDSLPAERLPEGHFIGPAACVPARLAALCDLVALADSPERRALIDLRLEAIAHDACWRFHRDHVGYRLNATYRGPGTQWPPLEHAARALKAQRRYRGPLNEFPRFAAGLFKGVVRAGTEAIVHRSPPVAGSGQTRLFLCLNEVHDDE